MMIEQTELSPVSHTMLMTLAARASAPVTAPDTEFHDPWSEAVASRLPWDLSSYRNDLDLVRHVALRARLIDDLAAGFFLNDPGAIGVSLGCGLCSRGRRVSDALKEKKPAAWMDIDLPDVVNIRKRVLPPIPGERLMACGLMDMAWIDAVFRNNLRSVMIVMEGVSAYLTAEENMWLFQSLGRRLANTGIKVDMIFDCIHPALADSRFVTNKAGGTRMPFQSGFVDSDAVKRLHPTIQVVSEHEVYSRISPRHKLFAMEFEAASRGKRPCSIIHIRFGSHD